MYTFAILIYKIIIKLYNKYIFLVSSFHLALFNAIETSKILYLQI